MKHFIIFILLSFSVLAHGQEARTKLHEEILVLDSLLFEETFNKCNFEHIGSLISEDFEFYHDQSGITEGKEEFISSIRQNICSLSYRPRRELVKGSNQVFPLSNNGELYGVIQNGVHRFYANEDGKEEYFTSIADFTHLWILEDKKWRLKRVLSYNHRSKFE